jgi:hypothetical protein
MGGCVGDGPFHRGEISALRCGMLRQVRLPQTGDLRRLKASDQASTWGREWLARQCLQGRSESPGLMRIAHGVERGGAVVS